MQDVAHHLQTRAQREAKDKRDAFARSAYNRYYYASFLLARDFIRRTFPDQKDMAHASYPDFLEGTVAKEIKRGIKLATRTGDQQLIPILKKAEFAVYSLAGQFKKANAVRIIADYYPEKPVKFSDKNRFSLENTNISDAHDWCAQTIQYISIIEGAWNQLNAT